MTTQLEPGVRPIGSLVKGKWRITSVLRSGTAAALYLATNRAGSGLALKIIHAHAASDERLRARLLAEAEISSTIDHPGVVRALDDDVTEDGAGLLLLEPLDGESLEARRERLGGALPLEDVFDVAELLLDVVRAAHDKNVFHFEITPNNLFLSDTGLLKVLDFGALDGRPFSVLERGRIPIVWPGAFTAPELLLDEGSDPRSDIWAVGALLYTLVTGATARPLDAPAQSVASVPARALKESGLELPRALVNIVDRALEFDRADRWPDVEAMQQALRWARRSMEGGWGQDDKPQPMLQRPSRSSLAEQAKLSRLRSTPPPRRGESGVPPTGPTPVDFELPEGAQQAQRSDSAAANTPQHVMETLVGVQAPAASTKPEKPQDLHFERRSASEPTLPSASIVPDNDDDNATPTAKRLVPHLPNTAVALPPAPDTTPNAEEAEREPDTLIRPVPQGASPPDAALAPTMLALPAVANAPSEPTAAASAVRDAPGGQHPEKSASTSSPPPSELEPSTTPKPVFPPKPAPAVPPLASVIVQAAPMVEAAGEHDPPPPTVRLPARSTKLFVSRNAFVAGSAAVFALALLFALWPRGSGDRSTGATSLDAAPATLLPLDLSDAPKVLVAASGESADAAATAVTAREEDSGPDDAASDAAAADDAAVVSLDTDEDAAAILEAKLAAERRRRRERAALEAARAQEAGLDGEGTSTLTAPARNEDASPAKPTSSANVDAAMRPSTATTTTDTATSDEDAGT